MKFQLLLLIVIASLASFAQCYHVPGCCMNEFPLRLSSEVISHDDNTDGETCPISSPQRDEAITRIDTQVDDLIDSVLFRIQDLIDPSPCKGPGWIRVAYLDMRSDCFSCPSSWKEVNQLGKRLCGRDSAIGSCEGPVFPVHGLQYSQICGRIVGYQKSSTEAFADFQINPTRGINDVYVDGVSVTRGSPRKHVWTFAAGIDEGGMSDQTCPCITNSDVINIPGFIGESYFCESGVETYIGGLDLFPDDPLWDGEGCGFNSECCVHHNPPWFMTTLAGSSNDDIEVRICAGQGNVIEDIPVEVIEIYVK